MKSWIPLLATSLVLLSPGMAQNLSEFTLGEVVSGEKVDLNTLEGKVVAIEYWGTR